MKSSRLILINILVFVAIIVIGGVAFYYYNQSNNYVTSQDAVISANSVPVIATVPGTVHGLSVTMGQRVTKGEILARLTVASGTASSMSGGQKAPSSLASRSVNIVSPVTGTVAQISAVNGQLVGVGSPVVTLVQLGSVYVTANIPETKIRKVTVGQTVDITVDAHPGVVFHGSVQSIQPATQSFFSLIPTSATAGSYTKVIQRVPVDIKIDKAGYTLLPGESAEVTIHLNG